MLSPAGTFVVVTLTAVYVPARSATRVNPIVVLREDQANGEERAADAPRSFHESIGG
jgi:hypothetical protein